MTASDILSGIFLTGNHPTRTTFAEVPDCLEAKPLTAVPQATAYPMGLTILDFGFWILERGMGKQLNFGFWILDFGEGDGHAGS